MIYNVFYPLKELEDIVKQYLVITSLDGIDSLLFLPNGCNFILFNRGFEGYTKIYNQDKKFSIPKSYSISVKNNKVKKFILSHKNSDYVKFPLILVELTPIGFYKLFNRDASVLKESYLEIEKGIVDRYFKDLYTHESIEDELDYLNSSLIALSSTQNNKRMCIEDVIDKIIYTYHFEVTIKKLLEELDCSRSKLEREFKKIIGLTPKNFIYISKFCKTAVAYIEDECRFSEMKYLYSDHSHMNSVFKKFFGVNPSLIFDDVSNQKIQIYQMQKTQEFLIKNRGEM